MVIMSRTFDLLNWLLPKSERFPRLYRFTLTQRLMQAALDFQEELFAAEVLRGRQRFHSLQKCDMYLNRLRCYLRLIHGWRWIDDGQYQHVSVLVAEIGRLLGGWMKQSQTAH